MSNRDMKIYVIPVMLVMLFSTFDSFFTIYLIDSGAKEINPIMNKCLDVGVDFFLFVKYTLTALGLAILYAFQDHFIFGGKVKTRNLIWLIVVIYFILITYEFALLWTSYHA